jgi:hypothetical protein
MKAPFWNGSTACVLAVFKALAVSSFSLLLAGCASPEDNALLGVALGGVAPYARTAQSAASAATMGQALTTFGSAQASAPRLQANPTGTAPKTSQTNPTGAAPKSYADRRALQLRYYADKGAWIHRSNLSAQDKAKALAELEAWKIVVLKRIDEEEQRTQVHSQPTDQQSRPSSVTALMGSIAISVSEEGAEVYLGADFLGNAPSKIALPVGKHCIEIKKSGFKPFRRDILITQGAELTLKVVLERE